MDASWETLGAASVNVLPTFRRDFHRAMKNYLATKSFINLMDPIWLYLNLSVVLKGMSEMKYRWF